LLIEVLLMMLGAWLLMSWLLMSWLLIQQPTGKPTSHT